MRRALHTTLEPVTQRELNNPWVPRAGDPSESAAAKCRADTLEVRVIENIEQLAAELEGVPLVDSELLVQGHVEVDQAGAMQDSRASRAEESVGWPRKRTD